MDPNSQEVADVKLSLLTQDAQDGEDKCQSVTTHDAVHKLKMIDNETLAYFMARTQLFLLSVGIRADCLRFRQHLKTEMAHYAQGQSMLLLQACFKQIRLLLQLATRRLTPIVLLCFFSFQNFQIVGTLKSKAATDGSNAVSFNFEQVTRINRIQGLLEINL